MVFEFPLYTQLSKVKNSLQNATAKNTRLPPQQLPITELSSWKKQNFLPGRSKTSAVCILP